MGIPRQAAQEARDFDAFGVRVTDERTPTSQVDFVYGLLDEVETYAFGTGASNSASGGLVSVTSGTDPFGTATTQALREVRYRPGQGITTMFTALFDTPNALQAQFAGIGNPTTGYYFGYLEIAGGAPEFGITHVYGGQVEVRALTITIGSSNDENVTITLNDDADATVAVTNTGDTAATAAEIAAHDYTAVGNGWDAQAVGSVVYFISKRAGDYDGTYSLSSATSAVGSFARTNAGVNNTLQHYPISEWNGAKIDTDTFDPTKGNVYRIDASYLGFGPARFYMCNPGDGAMELVHTIPNVNRRTTPVLTNPGMSLRWIASNFTATTSVTVQGASGATFITGKQIFQTTRAVAIDAIGYTTGAEKPLVSIEVRRVFRDQGFRGQIKLRRIVVASDGTKSSIVRLRKDATLTAPVFSYVDETDSVVLVDSSATATTGGDEVGGIALAKEDSEPIPRNFEDVVLGLGERITVTAEGAAASTYSVILIWSEER